jgi:hypothetical protein
LGADSTLAFAERALALGHSLIETVHADGLGDPIDLDDLKLLEQDGKPKWRATSSVTWTDGPVRIGAFGSYVSSLYISDFLGDDGAEYKLNGQGTFNLYAQYTFEKSSRLGTPTIRVGVRNITSKQLPIDPDNGYRGSLYNPYGRYWYMSLGAEF